jgi:Skp family chaperone for outer membrane proteins
MKNKILLFLVLLICTTKISFAKGINVAIIDIDQVISDSSVYKSLQNSLQTQNLKYQQELSSYETKIMALDKEISQNPNNLNQEQIDKLKAELSQFEIEAQKMIQKRRIILDNAFSKAMEQIKTSLFDIIKKFAKEKNIQLILPKSQTLYNIDSIELTAETLRLLNTSIQSINVKFEE